jgi:hypothetical protein
MDAKRLAEIADALIEALEDDNGGPFPATVRQRRALVAGVHKMLAAGCLFTQEDVDEIATGEAGEVQANYGQVDGFSEVTNALDSIFNGGETADPPDPESMWALHRKQLGHATPDGMRAGFVAGVMAERGRGSRR